MWMRMQTVRHPLLVLNHPLLVVQEVAAELQEFGRSKLFDVLDTFTRSIDTVPPRDHTVFVIMMAYQNGVRFTAHAAST